MVFKWSFTVYFSAFILFSPANLAMHYFGWGKYVMTLIVKLCSIVALIHYMSVFGFVFVLKTLQYDPAEKQKSTSYCTVSAYEWIMNVLYVEPVTSYRYFVYKWHWLRLFFFSIRIFPETIKNKGHCLIIALLKENSLRHEEPTWDCSGSINYLVLLVYVFYI